MKRRYHRENYIRQIIRQVDRRVAAVPAPLIHFRSRSRHETAPPSPLSSMLVPLQHPVRHHNYLGFIKITIIIKSEPPMLSHRASFFLLFHRILPGVRSFVFSLYIYLNVNFILQVELCRLFLRYFIAANPHRAHTDLLPLVYIAV